jgi:hypothetical protein
VAAEFPLYFFFFLTLVVLGSMPFERCRLPLEVRGTLTLEKEFFIVEDLASLSCGCSCGLIGSWPLMNGIRDEMSRYGR